MKENREFRKDLKRVYDVMVHAPETGWYLKTTKGEVLRLAKDTVIEYYFTDVVYANRRTVMVIK